MIVKFEKALYGCFQSALLLVQLFEEHPRKNWIHEQIRMMNAYSLNHPKKIIALLLHTCDDSMIISSDENLIDDVIKLLENDFKEITVNRGNTHSYLGMQFCFNAGQVEIKMKGYVENLLNEDNIESTLRYFSR